MSVRSTVQKTIDMGKGCNQLCVNRFNKNNVNVDAGILYYLQIYTHIGLRKEIRFQV